MVNTLNKKIYEELSQLFKETDDCVLVDFHGLAVEEINALRSGLTENHIRMQVVKTSLAHIALRDMGRTGHEDMLRGPTAVVWGGDGIVQLSKTVSQFMKKTKKLKVKGGFLAAKSISEEDIKKLTTVPDRPVLLGMLVSSFMDPLQGMANGIHQLLGNIASLIDALQKKVEGEGGGGTAPAANEN